MALLAWYGVTFLMPLCGGLLKVHSLARQEEQGLHV